MSTILEDVNANDGTAPTSLKVAETRYGNDIHISRCPNGRLFQIDVGGGGTKPPDLLGFFTRFGDAEEAIKRYVDTHHGRLAQGVASVVDFVAKPGSVVPPLTNRPKLSMRPKVKDETKQILAGPLE